MAGCVQDSGGGAETAGPTTSVDISAPLGHGAQAHRVHPQIVRSRFQVVGIALRVLRAGGHRATRRAELQEQQSTQGTTGASADGAFHDIVGVLGVVLR